MTTAVLTLTVQPVHVPSPRDVAVLPDRRQPDARTPSRVEQAAADTVREARALVSRLRAAGLPPGLAACITAGFLEAAVAVNPELAGWWR